MDSESFLTWGPTLTIFFLVDDGREDPNTTISGPSSTRQRNAIAMEFHRRVDNSPALHAGLVAL